MQRSSQAKKAIIYHQQTLMPKRIQSALRTNKKEELPVKKKEKKDRSALIGLKRTRKSRDQICKL